MDVQLQAIIYASAGMVGFGIVNGLAKGLAIKLGELNFIIIRNFFVVLTLLPMIFIFWDKHTFDLEYMFYGVLISIAVYFGYYFFIKGLRVGKVAIVDPVASSRVLISLFIGIIFFEDDLTRVQIISIFGVFTGIILLSVDIKELRNSKMFDKKSGIYFGLLAALIWGVSLPMMSIASTVIGAFLFTLILEGVVLIISSIQILLSQNSHLEVVKLKDRKVLLLIVLAGIISALGSLLMNLGYETEEISIVSAVTAASSLVSGIFAAIFYKERLKPIQYLGGTLIILGIICIAYFRG